MFIRRDEYLRLKDCEDLNIELKKEVKRLEQVINTQVRNCKVGIWCEGCEHWTKDRSVTTSNNIIGYSVMDMYFGATMPLEIGGQVGYCRKHIHDLCPEFTKSYHTDEEG